MDRLNKKNQTAHSAGRAVSAVSRRMCGVIAGGIKVA